ncbi:MAG: hypothetical protein WCI60_04590 [bacterium]
MLNPELMQLDGGEIDDRQSSILNAKSSNNAMESALAAQAAAEAQAAQDAADAKAASDAKAAADAAAKIAADKAAENAIKPKNSISQANFVNPVNQVNSIPPTPAIVVSATPINTPIATTVVVPPAKTAPIDTVLFDNSSVPIEIMTDLIFEDIGGQELINIARNDIINGQQISYSTIKNLASIQQQYNPNNIISLQSTSDKYFANFSIKLNEKIPNVGNGPSGSNVYIDEATGDLIIETINTLSDEQVDVQIAISGTIYEADI